MSRQLSSIGCALVVGACSATGPDGPEVVPVDSPAAPGAAIWVLTHDGAANWLYRVNPTTFAIERETRLGGTGVLWEIAGGDGRIAFAIDREADLLVALDLEGGSIGPAVKLGGDMQANGRGFGATAQGTLYGDFAGTLAEIDPATGALLKPVTLEFGALTEAIDGCGDELYMASRESGSPKGERLYRVDASTGKVALIGQIGATAIDIDSMACSPDGQLFGVDADPTLGRTVFQIDRLTGDRTVRAELPVAGSINGIHVVGSSTTDPAP